MAPIRPIVLCGGSGSRLWPASRPDRPKPLLALATDGTLLADTVARFAGPGFRAPWLVAGADHAGAMADAAPDAERIVVEPVPRGTAAAVAVAARIAADVDGPEALVLASPADHAVTDVPPLLRAIAVGAQAAAGGAIVTFGIVPSWAATGYGWIAPGEGLGPGTRRVAAFVEKPDAPEAEVLLRGGRHLWNSGLFLFRADVVLRELELLAPGVRHAVDRAVAAAIVGGRRVDLDHDTFAQGPSASFDRAVLEHTAHAAVVPVACGWSDVGTWEAVRALRAGASVGPSTVTGSPGAFTWSDGPPIVVRDCPGVTVIASAGGVLVVGGRDPGCAGEGPALHSGPPHTTPSPPTMRTDVTSLDSTPPPLDGPPAPGSPEELTAFAALQSRIGDLYHTLAQDTRAPQTVVIVPSLSMDPRELAKVTGFYHYEERQLVNLMLLRQPRTKVIYVTSQALDPVVVDYYLSLMPGIPSSHARRRLVMLDCNDRATRALSLKICDRPRLVERIKAEIDDPSRAHIVCFNSSPAERTLAVRLGLPLHSVDPELSYLGTKSGCRETFRQAGVLLPFGFENLSTPAEMAQGLAAIKRRDPGARRAVVKLNEGFSGEGNALFYYGDLDGTLSEAELARRIVDRLPTLKFEAPDERWESFAQKYSEMKGVVEAFVEGEIKASPSAQCRVNAIGEAQVISTHDQVLGGPSGQVFLGCTFPAIDPYRLDIQTAGARIAEVLARKGVIGRFGIDFVSVREPGSDTWQHFAIEVNLRKGGTTHPFLTLKFLTGGTYNLEDGLFYAQSGRPKYYYSTDTLQADRYKGLRAEDLIDIAVYHDMHFHGPTERGVVFHLIGALSEFGKLGVVSIGDNHQQAKFLYNQALQVLDEETGHRRRR